MGYDTIIDSPNVNQFFKDKCLEGILGIIFFFAFFFFFSLGSIHLMQSMFVWELLTPAMPWPFQEKKS